MNGLNELPNDIPESFQKAFFNRLFGVDVGIIFYFLKMKTSNGSKSMKFSSLDLAIAPNRREYQKLRIGEIKF